MSAAQASLRAENPRPRARCCNRGTRQGVHCVQASLPGCPMAVERAKASSSRGDEAERNRVDCSVSAKLASSSCLSLVVVYWEACRLPSKPATLTPRRGMKTLALSKMRLCKLVSGAEDTLPCELSPMLVFGMKNVSRDSENARCATASVTLRVRLPA